MQPEMLKELVEGKFVDALRTVAAEMTMEEMHEKRGEYVKRVKAVVASDLLQNGLELETVSLTQLDQTGMEFFNPSNAFDAEGLTRLTEQIERRKKIRNDIEQDTMIQVRNKNLETERQALLPLPTTPYDMAAWKQVKLHRDCHIVFDHAYYSAPYRLVGQQLWVRGGTREVYLYTSDYQLVATHPRAQRPGQRLTHLDHLPPHKVPGLILSRDGCRQRAAEIGPATCEVVERLLDHRPEDRLRTAGRLLRLGDRFGSQRLEVACVRALRFDDPAYVTIKHVLEQGLDAEELPVVEPAPLALTFVRTAAELVGHLVGGAAWR
jgi:hypothetical protein